MNVALFPRKESIAAGFWFECEVLSLVGMDDLRRRLYLNRVRFKRGFYEAECLRRALDVALRDGTHGARRA